MRTTDLFTNNRSPKKLNETIEKTFGIKLNLESFTIEQLEDARNKLRTQIYTARSESSFNETVENDTLTQAQWMHDAIVAELVVRDEPIVDNTMEAEGVDFDEEKVHDLFVRFEETMNDMRIYGDYDHDEVMKLLRAGDIEAAVEVFSYHWGGQNGEEVDLSDYYKDLEDNLDYVINGPSKESYNNTQLESGDNEVASVLGRVADEEDFDKLYDLFGDNGAVGQYLQDQIDDITGETGLHRKDDFQQIEQMVMDRIQQEFGGQSDDEGGETDDGYALASAGHGSDEDYGGDFDQNESAQAKTNDKLLAYYAKRKAEKDQQNKNESINTGDDMRNLKEGEIQQASAIVTAKTMVDRVGRWIEELSGMENDTLLQLGDSIRDEMGQDLAKNFISTVAPAIQTALENLKSTRETLATGVRTLTGEEQPAEMLGAEPGMDMGAEAGAEMGPAEPDAMNADASIDDFAAAEPAIGGAEAAGREQRESINRSSNLLRTLAG